MTGAMPLCWPMHSVPISRVSHRLQLDAPQLLRLRELSRAEETLLEDFRRSANRLREQLHRFYPQILELCAAADASWLWDLIDLAPTPAHAALLSEEHVQRVLKAHRIRRITAQEVLACLQAPALPVAPGAAEAAQAHCGVLAALSARPSRATAGLVANGSAPCCTPWLRSRARVRALDVAIVQSLPGVGRKDHGLVVCRSCPGFDRTGLAVRTHGGVAPVTRQSGKRRQVVDARGVIRGYVMPYHMACVAIQRDAHFSQVYAALRAKGHGCSPETDTSRFTRRPS